MRDVQPETSKVSWRTVVGELGQPLPRLRRQQKQDLKRSVGKGMENEPDRRWRLRVAVISGSPISPEISGVEIRETLQPVDIVRHLDRFARHERLVDVTDVVSELPIPSGSKDQRRMLTGLANFLQAAPKKRGSQNVKTLLKPETAKSIITLGWRAALPLLADNSPLMHRPRQRKNLVKQVVDLLYLATTKAEVPETAAVGIEVLRQLEKRVGTTELEQVDAHGPQRVSYLLALPAQLIERALLGGCLSDAEALASRSRHLKDALSQLQSAVRSALSRPELPMASRHWAEAFLELHSTEPANVDTADDVNVERMATLLLAAWEARSEGSRSSHYFELFSSLCANAFKLRLGGNIGAIAEFDPALHQAVSRDKDLNRQSRVRIVRPWVQWGEEPIFRIIVPALVEAT
jgi:hypothetical protein